jgi:hypothetical protein
MFSGVTDGGVQGVEHRRQPHDTVVGGAAAAGPDGDGRCIAAVIKTFGQRRNEVLAYFYRGINAMLSMGPAARSDALAGAVMEQPECNAQDSLLAMRSGVRRLRRA